MLVTFRPIRHPFGHAGYVISFTFWSTKAGTCMATGHSTLPILCYADAIRAAWKCRGITRKNKGVLPNLSEPWTVW